MPPLHRARLLPLFLMGILTCFASPAGAVEIISPKDGEVIPIGSEVVIQVKASPGDDIVRVYLSHSDEAMKHNDQTDCFEQRIKLRGDTLGAVPIEVWSINSKEVTSTASVTIHINLPPVLPLISLRIHAEQRKLVLEGIGEHENLQVIGEFPDGTVRFVSKEVFGTTYRSGDEHVVTVDANGLVTAVGVGETTIQVRNGERETQAQIIVRPKPLEPRIKHSHLPAAVGETLLSGRDIELLSVIP
jgi:hypothetical protein